MIDLILENNKKLNDYKILLERAKKNKIYDEILDLENLVNKMEEKIKKVEYKINHYIYNLYGLTEEEIKIIEEVNTKG